MGLWCQFIITRQQHWAARVIFGFSVRRVLCGICLLSCRIWLVVVRWVGCTISISVLSSLKVAGTSRRSTTSPASRQQWFIGHFPECIATTPQHRDSVGDIQNDHLNSVDRKKVVLTVLLDMSAAFDTIDHSMLIGQGPYSWRKLHRT